MTTQRTPHALQKLVHPSVLHQPVYQPGRPIEEVARELGLDPAGVLKLASNENLLGPSPKALAAMLEACHHVEYYPDGSCYYLKQALAEHHQLEPEHFLIGNGSNEIIELLGHAFLGSGYESVMGTPAFIVYKLVTLLFGASPVEIPLTDYRHDLEAMRKAIGPKTRLVFLPSPNNPTGTTNSAKDIRTFAESLPEHTLFVFDEAYAEYLEEPPDLRDLIRQGRPIVCLRTFSKIHALAGLRLGYGYGPPELMRLLERVRQPFNINSVAQAAGIAALQDSSHVVKCRAANRTALGQVETGLRELGLECIPSEANFVTVRLAKAREVHRRLQAGGLIVRPLEPYGMADWLRITLGTPEQNQRCLDALAAVLADPTTSP